MATYDARRHVTLDQYKVILATKASMHGSSRPREKTYMALAKELGLLPSRVINAAQRGIKRYDYQIWKEGET